MTRHDPDREYEGIPLPDGDDELTAVLAAAIDVDQGWQELLHRTRASTPQEGSVGRADAPGGADPSELPNTRMVTIPRGQAGMFSRERPLPYGIDNVLDVIARLAGEILAWARPIRARGGLGFEIFCTAEHLQLSIDFLRKGLSARTLEREEATEILGDCQTLASIIADDYGRSSSTRLRHQMAENARTVECLLAELDRLIARLFDDSDATDPYIPVRPGP